MIEELQTSLDSRLGLEFPRDGRAIFDGDLDREIKPVDFQGKQNVVGNKPGPVHIVEFYNFSARQDDLTDCVGISGPSFEEIAEMEGTDFIFSGPLFAFIAHGYQCYPACGY